MNEPDFNIFSREIISKEFLDRDIKTFIEAAHYVRNLKYKRNRDKNNLTSVFKENCGTCSTKHGVLKQLAIENNFECMELVIGIFKMNSTNTPEIAKTLQKYNLEYIPEAHCYLKFNGKILDYTKPEFKHHKFKKDLLKEQEILPYQILSYKINEHQNYIKNWLEENPNINYTFDKIWEIREQCISDLSL